MRYGYLSLCLSLGLTVQGQAVWQQFSSAPAAGRFWAAATGNSTHGYAGTGRLQFSGTGNEVADMYEYEAATDTWTAIPDYPGGVRAGVDGFTIGERIFFGSADRNLYGVDFEGQEIWKYNAGRRVSASPAVSA